MKDTVNKIRILFFYSIPIVVLISLIPFITNDYALALLYLGSIVTLYFTKHEPHDLFALLFGLIGITVSEYLFVSTGVETFTRNSLFGIMPIWLPLLWSYAFLTIKRCLVVIAEIRLQRY